MKNYDQNLRDAMSQIEAIFKAYDIGGFVDLHSKTHGEYKLLVEHMSWSNIRFLREDAAVHIKIHMKSNAENTEATVGMIANMREMAAMLFARCDMMMDKIKEQVTVVHIPLKDRINNDDRSEQ